MAPIIGPMLGEVLGSAAAIVWPRRCPSCEEPLTEARAPWCPQCRQPPPSGPFILGGLGPVVAAGRYEGTLAATIRAWKLGGRRDLTVGLADALTAAVQRLVPEGTAVALVPVPARRSSRSKRGADLIAELARSVARGIPMATAVTCLDWSRPVSEQVGATPGQRRANLAGALVARSCPSCAIVVVDDVLTTGATLSEAVRAIRGAGGGPVAAAVLGVVGDVRSGAHAGAEGG